MTHTHRCVGRHGGHTHTHRDFCFFENFLGGKSKYIYMYIGGVKEVEEINFFFVRILFLMKKCFFQGGGNFF